MNINGDNVRVSDNLYTEAELIGLRKCKLEVKVKLLNNPRHDSNFGFIYPVTEKNLLVSDYK